MRIGVRVAIVLALTAGAAQAIDLKLPYTNGETWTVTCGYGCGAHSGSDAFALDFTLNGCDAWDKPVRAVAGGTVASVSGSNANTCGTLSYGLVVVINHSDGITSAYAHLNSASVSAGQTVSQGDQIGTCGNSGNACGSACSSHPGTHLHFHMRQNGSAYKPEPMSGYSNFASGGWYTSNNGGGGGTPTNGAQFISGNIPGSMNINQGTSVAITFKNTGTSTWRQSDGYRLGAVGDSDPFTGTTRHNMPGDVGPGSQTTFNFSISAPGTAGTYTSDWRMIREGVEWFGDTYTATVSVGGSPPWNPGSKKNILQYNASFDSYPGGDWKEPNDWKMIWGDYANDWFWRIGNSYGSYNGTCGWSADQQGKMGIRPNDNRNVLIGQEGWESSSSYPWRNPMSHMGFRARTRLVAKVWRKTCRNNLFLGWSERERQWTNDGGNAQFKLKQGGDCDSDNAEGNIEHKDWTNDWCEWVGGLVGVHEGGWDSNGRLTMFDDYYLSFEIAAQYKERSTPSELWAGTSQGGAWVRLGSNGWDNFGHRTGDWRMKAANDDGGRIAANTNGSGMNVQTSVSPSGDEGTFYFNCYGYTGGSHDPYGDNNFSPEFYFRREGGDDVDCVKWADNSGDRNRQLKWSFPFKVKGHKPQIQSLSALQNPSNPNLVEFSFTGSDRRSDNITYSVLQYRIGAGGSWTNAPNVSVSSSNFAAAGTAITATWNVGATLGQVNRSDLYFQIQVGDGVYTSDAAVIGPFGVTFSSPPEIVTHPAPISVCDGQNASFTAAADGEGVTIRWQKDGSDLSDGGPYGGTETGTLSITGVDASLLGDYRLRATNADGTVYSNPAALGLLAETAITASPQPLSLCLGQQAQFTVTATGDGTLAYRWQKDGVDLYDGPNISGADGPTLTLAAVTPPDEGMYRCAVLGTCGPADSDAASLEVRPLTEITLHPQGAAICPGDSVQFAVDAVGDGELTFRWQKDGVDLADDAHYAGTGSNTLSVTDVTVQLAGAYQCVVTGGCGEQTSQTAQLEIAGDTAITQSPAGATVCEGEPVQLSVTATGGQPFTYEWLKNGQPFGAPDQPTLDLPAAGLSDSGTYTVQVTGGCGPPVVSEPAEVVVNRTTLILGDPISQPACGGQPVTLSVFAVGTPPFHYVWYKDGQPIPGAPDAEEYVIDSASPEDVGSYSVEVTATCGPPLMSAPAVISFNAAPEMVGGYSYSAFIDAGSNCPLPANQFEVSATDPEQDTLTWRVRPGTEPALGTVSFPNGPVGNQVVFCYDPIGTTGWETFIIEAVDTCGGTAFAYVDVFVMDAPQVTSWKSFYTHGSAGELAVAFDPAKTDAHTGGNGPVSEPRQPGLRKLVVDFNEPVEPADGTLDVGDVTLTGTDGVTPAPFVPSSLTLTEGNYRLVMTFDPPSGEISPLPAAYRYTIDLAGHFIGGWSGLDIGGDADCQVRAVPGDANGDGRVNLIDLAAAKSNFNAAVNAATLRYDADGSGAIDLIDLLSIRSKYGTQAP